MKKALVTSLVNYFYFFIWYSIILDDVAFRTLAYSYNAICYFTGPPEFISVDFPVDRSIELRIMEKDKVMNGNYAFGLFQAFDTQWKFVAQSVKYGGTVIP